MLTELQREADGKLLILSGALMKADDVLLTSEVERMVKDHRNIRLLITMKRFYGWTMGANWNGVNCDLQDFSHIERLALVGEKRWEAEMAIFCKPFTTAEVRSCDECKTNDADVWIHAGIARAERPSRCL